MNNVTQLPEEFIEWHLSEMRKQLTDAEQQYLGQCVARIRDEEGIEGMSRRAQVPVADAVQWLRAEMHLRSLTDTSARCDDAHCDGDDAADHLGA